MAAEQAAQHAAQLQAVQGAALAALAKPPDERPETQQGAGTGQNHLETASSTLGTWSGVAF